MHPRIRRHREASEEDDKKPTSTLMNYVCAAARTKQGLVGHVEGEERNLRMGEAQKMSGFEVIRHLSH